MIKKITFLLGVVVFSVSVSTNAFAATEPTVTVNEENNLTLLKDVNIEKQDIPVDTEDVWDDHMKDLLHPVNTIKIEPNIDQPVKKENSHKEITVKATAYTASCEGCTGITATGVNIKDNPNKKVIAVDPDVIPLGTKVYVEGFGEAIAADTGGAIKGKRIDIFIPSEKDAIEFGVKKLKVKILN